MRNKKRILHIAKTMDMGGAEKVVLQLANYFRNKYEVKVASMGGAYVEILKQNNIEHFQLPGYQWSVKNIFNLFFSFKRIVNDYKPNIVHTHHRLPSFFSELIKRQSFIHIHTMHTVFFDKVFLTKLLKPNVTVAVGKSVYNNMIDVFNYSEDELVLINNGVNIHTDPVFHKKEIKKVYCIGRLTELKGQKYLLHAIDKLRLKLPDGAVFKFVGTGPDESELEKLASALGVTKMVRFLGKRIDTDSLYEDADLVVLPSFQEGLPLVLLESLAYGLPVIAADIESNRELVLNGKTGLIVKPRDAKELAEAIYWMIKNPVKAYKMAKEGYDMVKEKYTLEKMLYEYERLYDGIKQDNPSFND